MALIFEKIRATGGKMFPPKSKISFLTVHLHLKMKGRCGKTVTQEQIKLLLLDQLRNKAKKALKFIPICATKKRPHGF